MRIIPQEVNTTTDKKKEKEKKPRTTKTAAELDAAYLGRVEHAVQSVDKWLEKLTKLCRSKRYNIGEDRKTVIMVHLEKALDASIENIRGVAPDTTKFKLP